VHQGSIITAAVLLCALLAACGTDDPSGATVTTVAGSAAGNVGSGACNTCHSQVFADWLQSNHANAAGGDLNSSGTPAYSDLQSDPNCAACHDPLGEGQSLVAGLTGNVPRPVVGCEACHGGGEDHAASGGGSGPLGTATLPAAVIGTTSTVPVSAQFRTCTACHELLSPTDPASTTTPATAAHVSTAPTGNANVITDSHFARPRATSGLFGINGFVMDFASDKVCTNCHNPHKLNTAINTEWAQSAHSDRFRAGQDPRGYFSGAWAVINWSTNPRCQRCHTTSGFAKYADALKAGDRTTVDGMIDGTIVTMPSNTDYKPEMLHCNGCHTDNKGGLRNPGPVTARYDVVMSYPTNTYPLDTFAGVSHTYPEAFASNVCLTCHVGRESGDSIKQLNVHALPAVDFNSLAFQSSHFLTAGGTVFAATGYEFNGRSYDNPASYLHNQIGMNDFRSTGTNGPCVGCHMSRPNKNGNHLFLPISRFNRVRTNAGTVSVANSSATVTGSGTSWDTAGIDPITDTVLAPDGRVYLIASVDNPTQITLTTAYSGTGSAQVGANKNYVIAKDGLRVEGIASEICFNCHAGTTTALVDQLNEGRELFEDALRAIEHALDMKGFCFFDGNFQRLRYRDGTVTVTQGSAVVSGLSTTFLTAGISAGNNLTSTDKFRIYDGDEYDILSVDSDAQITLKSPFLGATASGVSYAIFRSGSSNRVTDWTGADNDATGAASGKNNMGAAFNFNLFEHDPGAYVHNRTYVKRLIYDSIDWIDDGQMNYSVGATLNALGPEPYKAGAIEYLLPNGILGIAAERP
jgi:hypothetical protein